MILILRFEFLSKVGDASALSICSLVYILSGPDGRLRKEVSSFNARTVEMDDLDNMVSKKQQRKL
ncbi:MAG: hypothetical protein WBX01_08810 [Nitrososphaeraceae archaeon]